MVKPNPLALNPAYLNRYGLESENQSKMRTPARRTKKSPYAILISAMIWIQLINTETPINYRSIWTQYSDRTMALLTKETTTAAKAALTEAYPNVSIRPP